MSVQVSFHPKSQRELSVRVVDGANLLADIPLDAESLDKLIGQLVMLRRNLKPEISRTPPNGQVPGEIDPIWAVLPFPLMDGKIMALRDSGSGWCLYQFPAVEAGKLAVALLAPSPETPTPQSGSGRPH